jgi:hypothetical protein
MMTLRSFAATLVVALLALQAGPGTAQHVYAPQTPVPPEVAIVSPADSEVVHNNLGAVVVSLAARELEPDEELVLLLDDEEVARDHALPEFVVLSDLERGPHRLQVLIVDADGDVVAESPVSSFHMWKASRLMRRGNGV